MCAFTQSVSHRLPPRPFITSLDISAFYLSSRGPRFLQVSSENFKTSTLDSDFTYHISLLREYLTKILLPLVFAAAALPFIVSIRTFLFPLIRRKLIHGVIDNRFLVLGQREVEIFIYDAE